MERKSFPYWELKRMNTKRQMNFGITCIATSIKLILLENRRFLWYYLFNLLLLFSLLQRQIKNIIDVINIIAISVFATLLTNTWLNHLKQIAYNNFTFIILLRSKLSPIHRFEIFHQSQWKNSTAIGCNKRPNGFHKNNNNHENTCNNFNKSKYNRLWFGCNEEARDRGEFTLNRIEMGIG